MKHFLYLLISFLIVAILTSNASAKNFKYRASVKLNVGQSIIIKGVRSRNCGDIAEKWTDLQSRLPKSKLGTFSDGGAGTTQSDFCGGKVAARGIKFTAEKVGKERLKIFNDFVRISVR